MEAASNYYIPYRDSDIKGVRYPMVSTTCKGLLAINTSTLKISLFL